MIRIVVGIVLIGIGAFAELPPIGMGISLAAGTIALVTGALAYCPVWQVFNFTTCPTKPVK